MIACLDTCVLYPTVMRQIIIGVAKVGLITPIWSDRIFAEWHRTADRLHPGDGVFATGEMARLKTNWPGATIPANPNLEAQLWLPDTGDIHVLATAISGQADTIITLNLKDFPDRELISHGIIAHHPDLVLYNLWLKHPSQIESLIRTILDAAQSFAPITLRALLKRSRLPRLGKALTR